MPLFPSDTLRIRRTSETRRVVEAYGELDLSTGPRLEDILCTVGGGPVTALDLDLSAVRLVDAYAMRCIQRAARKLAARGCTLRISAVRPQVRAVLGLVGFEQAVPIADDHPGAAGERLRPDGAARPA